MAGASIHMIYKYRADKQRYVEMYLLFMPPTHRQLLRHKFREQKKL